MSKRPIKVTAPTASLHVDRAQIRQAVERYTVRESVQAPERVVERSAVTEASVGGATATKPGRMAIRLIKAGWSLNSNHYGAQVLREAAANRAWAAGTACYIDHATDQEEQDHPSGSVKNLAAVLTEDARWDEGSQSIVAEVRLFAPWRDTLTDMAEHIGMSIRAWVTGEHGEAEGREGFVVQRIEAGRSCDFVTVPAAGGGIISVLEAVGNKVPVAEARNAGHWFEANIHSSFTRTADEMFGEGYLTREERITLSSAVGDGLAAFAARIEAEASHLYQRDPYAGPPEPVTAPTAEAVEPTPETPSTPEVDPNVTDGAPPPAPSTTNPEEEPVSGTQTGAPPEQAGIAPVPGDGQPPTTPTVPPIPAPEPTPQPTTESVSAVVQGMLAEAMKPLMEQLAAANAREAARDAADRTERNRRTAAEAVTRALRAVEHSDVAASIGDRVNTRVLAAVPTTAEGAVDETRLTETITAVIADESTHVRRERANALAEAGVGLPYGVGSAPAQEAAGDDGFGAEMNEFFSGVLGMSDTAASIASKGRC